jgi:hypothetical protein
MMFFTLQGATMPPTPVFSVDLHARVWGGAGIAVRPGTTTMDTQTGRVFVMSSGRSGIMVADTPSLEITKSIGISCWVKLDSYPSFASQLVFRGDDRTGLDPYTLVVHDGRVFFGVQNEKDEGANVSAPIGLGVWTHVVGSLDDSRYGAMRLWVDGELKDATRTTIRPFAKLDPNAAPGLGIGNVQNDRGPHNQPLQGSLADVRIYDCPITPKMVDYNPEGWKYPLREMEGLSLR